MTSALRSGRVRVGCHAVGQPPTVSTCRTVGAATMSGGLARLYVRRVRALGPGFGVVADLRALGERLEAAAGDATVVHEQVLALIVGWDEPVALVVVEPLHGSGCH